jgi:predicted TIM-barrel fold metal-dependent hydrolase
MIDGHVHIWELAPERYPWHQTLANIPIPTYSAPAEALLSEMDAAGVSSALLVQPSVYGYDNSYLCDSLERYPDRFAGVCLVDPRSESAGDDLRHRCAERGCSGMRLNIIGEMDASWILGPVQEGLWEAALEMAVSVSVQCLPAHSPVVKELAQRLPGIRFVIDFLGQGTQKYDATNALIALGEVGNVYYKLMAVGQVSEESYPFHDQWPFFETAMKTFGPSRLLLGSDFPHVREACSYRQAVGILNVLPFIDEDSRPIISDETARQLWLFN